MRRRLLVLATGNVSNDEGRADVIATGDADLLALEEHEGIAIVTPRAFLDLFPG